VWGGGHTTLGPFEGVPVITGSRGKETGGRWGLGEGLVCFRQQELQAKPRWIKVHITPGIFQETKKQTQKKNIGRKGEILVSSIKKVGCHKKLV